MEVVQILNKANDTSFNAMNTACHQPRLKVKNICLGPVNRIISKVVTLHTHIDALHWSTVESEFETW